MCHLELLLEGIMVYYFYTITVGKPGGLPDISLLRMRLSGSIAGANSSRDRRTSAQNNLAAPLNSLSIESSKFLIAIIQALLKDRF